MVALPGAFAVLPTEPSSASPSGELVAGLFDSQPWESIWSSAVTAAATPSHALQLEGTLKAACSIMPLETRQHGQAGRTYQKETVHLMPHITQLEL